MMSSKLLETKVFPQVAKLPWKEAMQKLLSHALKSCPSTLQFSKECNDLLAIGCYELCESSRKGCLSIHSFKSETLHDGVINSSPAIAEYGLAGVLELIWNPFSSSSIICICADNSIKILSLTSSTLNCTMDHNFQADNLLLSFDVNPNTGSTFLSDDKGNLLFVPSFDHFSMAHTWKGHDNEVWSVLFDPDSPFIAYSASDDSFIHCWDVRCKGPSSLLSFRHHEYGVTSLCHHPSNGNVLLSGSFDESIVLFDKRFNSVSKPYSNSSSSSRLPIQRLCKLGGGVWKMKWKKNAHNFYLACSLMQAGFAILYWHWNKSELCVLEHEDKGGTSLTYAIDWADSGLFSSEDEMTALNLFSSSFYEKVFDAFAININNCYV